MRAGGDSSLQMQRYIDAHHAWKLSFQLFPIGTADKVFVLDKELLRRVDPTLKNGQKSKQQLFFN
jgi:hypothetical protein